MTAGEDRSQEVWLRNRQRYATLLGLDMKPEQHEAPTAVYIDTRLPWERGEVVDEDGPGELEAGKPPTCHPLHGPRPAG